ncbi:MAG: GspE/PulE family protein [Rhodanobacter sp.]
MAEISRLVEMARRTLPVPPPGPRPEPIDTVELALVHQGVVKREDLVIHKREAERAGLPVADYLLQKHLLSRADYYHAIGLFHRDKGGVPVANARDLPDWDTIFNDLGQVLGGSQPVTTHLLLGLSTDLAAGRRQAFLLTTPGGTEGAVHAALVSRLLTSNFKIRATLIAESSVLEVVRAEWRTRTGGNKKGASTESELHDRWDKIIENAWGEEASDIHLTARRGRGELKFRIHGELEVQNVSLTEEDAMELSRAMYNTMVDAGSTKDGFNARAEQDAVVMRPLAGGLMRLRYSGLPVEPDGISVTLRLIPMNVQAKPKSPAQLGYSDDQCDLLERMFARSSGVILLLGTTGSGKSTSMANLLMQKVLDHPGKQLRTVEQPVEILIPGSNVSQTSVVGTDFVSTMRALLRADPDYLMVGEIRDPATADLALQAVRSGHLCVSTLHADGAPIAYDRLAGMGVKRADMASVGLVAGLIYQRLVATLCADCKVPAAKVAEDRHVEHVGILRRLSAYLGAEPMDGIYFRNATGCPKCKGRGVTGRTVCAEIMVPRAKMLKAIAEGDSAALWESWRAEIDPAKPELMRGRTAFEHALWKMRQGMCSPLDVEKEFKFLDEPVYG